MRADTIIPPPRADGIGLESVLFTAEKHGGTATFYHKGKVFCSDVVIPLK